MATISVLDTFTDANGNSISAVPAKTFREHIILVASTANGGTVPSGAKFALFSCNVDFYADFDGGTAAVPSSDTTTSGGAMHLNPVMVNVEDISAFSVISASAGIMTVMYYK